MVKRLAFSIGVVVLLNLAGIGHASSEPSPADGATDVPLNATLSWTPPWPIQHDVYFGTNHAAVAAAHHLSPEYMGRHADAAYDPGPLTPLQDYYWRIDDVSGELIIPGPVWSFTTDMPPIAVARNPHPDHEATDVPRDVILSWSPDSESDAQYVYFGTDYAAVYQATRTSPECQGLRNGQANSYDPGSLDPGQTHYWRIDSAVDVGTIRFVYKGLVWSFTTITTDETLVFSQLNFDLAGTVYDDTEWGSLTFTFLGQEPIMYLNVTVNGTWQVQNVPVLSIEGVDVEQTMTYCFDLGNDRGINVDSLTYSYEFSPLILEDMPGGGAEAPVVEEGIRFSPGVIDTEIVQLELVSAHPLIGGVALAPKKSAHANFPNQECDANECGPAAVSNSLQFLNTKWKLGIDAEETTIDEMKKATNWDKDGVWIDHDDTRPEGQRNAWWEDKKKYMEDNDYPITTRKITDLSKIAAEIDAGQDVEIVGDWHMAAIVGIKDLGGGKYSIDVAHDTKQGEAGGTKTETIIYDPNTKKFTGSPGFWDGSKFRYAIVECPSYYVLDGFESYLPPAVLLPWTDGTLGPDLPGNGTGSRVTLATDLAHAGQQSMIFEYHNDVQSPLGFYSETGRAFDAPQDWTRPGMEAISLWFLGHPDNDLELVYVALEDHLGVVSVVYHPDPSAPRTHGWWPWTVDLRQFDEVDLGGIGAVYLGAGERGASAPGGRGTLAFDDLWICTVGCSPQFAPAGDLNLDCIVDFADVAIVANGWLATAPVCDGCTQNKKCRYTLTGISFLNVVNWPGQELALGAKCVANRCLSAEDCDQTILHKEFIDPNTPNVYMQYTWTLDACTETLVECDCHNPHK